MEYSSSFRRLTSNGLNKRNKVAIFEGTLLPIGLSLKRTECQMGSLRGNTDVFALERLAAGTFEFPEDLPVSVVSKFGDWVWTWSDPTDKRLECYSPDRLTLDWRKILSRYNIPE